MNKKIRVHGLKKKKTVLKLNNELDEHEDFNLSKPSFLINLFKPKSPGTRF